ncbi:hypothetical protein SAMN05518871_101540 [Psychrobacillus sp. OK028]|uniref:DUF6115 domain-containing protein n=1 Tax=Psychrobacillus sp. OK028 TaxID=1884359 RepID=UPI00087F04C3|nr:hypothetical protein [Psychrobacillus sp. OK028]SDM56115.1 hypothetical protein SAMN05518871_101540 [Psychrobacillus sp. OK028]
MITTFLIILFLMQVLSFYFIALLNAKISRFDNMEQKQQQVLIDIENSFSAYIAEITDENNRLIQELKNTEVPKTVLLKNQVKPSEKEAEAFEPPFSFVSKQIAASSYLKTAQSTTKKVPETVREKVIFHFEEGKTSDEIAKMLQIGKTEVELFLKFND